MLATTLAGEASRDGRRTVMFDLDPQASASFWNTRSETLAITDKPSRLTQLLAAVREAGAACSTRSPGALLVDVLRIIPDAGTRVPALWIHAAYGGIILVALESLIAALAP